MRQRRADHGPLDPAEDPPDRRPALPAPPRSRPGARAGPLEVVALLADDPHVAVADVLPLDLLPSAQISLELLGGPARRSHPATTWRDRGLRLGRFRPCRTGRLQPAEAKFRVDPRTVTGITVRGTGLQHERGWCGRQSLWSRSPRGRAGRWLYPYAGPLTGSPILLLSELRRAGG